MTSLKNSLLKVIVIGESGAGKTSLVRQYTEQRFSIREKNTIGVNLSIKNMRVEDRVVTLQIWDTAGQERFSCLSSFFYRGVDCCVLVFDITNFASFKALDRWRDEFLIQASPSDPANFPFIVLGNKVDLVPGNSYVSRSLVNEWCQRNNSIPYFETSAKEGTNLDLAFHSLTRKALDLEPESIDVVDFPDTIILKSPDNHREKANECCS